MPASVWYLYFTYKHNQLHSRAGCMEAHWLSWTVRQSHTMKMNDVKHSENENNLSYQEPEVGHLHSNSVLVAMLVGLLYQL